MPSLEEIMAETQKVMNRNLVQELYGPNALVSFLGNTVTPRPLHERIQKRIGEFFLRIANRLGAYNDDY